MELLKLEDPLEVAKGLKSKNLKERRKAAIILSIQGHAAESALPALLAALKDQDAKVRLHATWAISRIGKAAKKAVPSLRELLSDNDIEVRRASAWALRTTGAELPEVLPALLKALKDTDNLIRVRAARLLLLRDYKEKQPLYRLLADAMDDQEYEVWSEARNTLGEVGLPAVPILRECLKDKRPKMRRCAIGGLSGVISKVRETKDAVPPEVIKDLIICLRDKDQETVRGAIFVLAEVGVEAKEAVLPITVCLKDSREAVRKVAAECLPAFGPASKVAIPALRKALQDEDEYVRDWAKKALQVLEK
jgi:HEAT repeat protein